MVVPRDRVCDRQFPPLARLKVKTPGVIEDVPVAVALEGPASRGTELAGDLVYGTGVGEAGEGLNERGGLDGAVIPAVRAQATRVSAG